MFSIHYETHDGRGRTLSQVDRLSEPRAKAIV